MTISYIDKTGKYVINPQFDEAGSFEDDIALVQVNEKYGFIDEEGEYIMRPQFEYATNFKDSKFLVEINGKYGVIDKKVANESLDILKIDMV